MDYSKIYDWQPLAFSPEKHKIRMGYFGLVEVIGPKGVFIGTIDPKGYQQFDIRYRGKKLKLRGQQLAYKQWIDPDYMPEGMKSVIDHIDSNKLNNHPSNLQRITHRANTSREKTQKSGLPVGVHFEKSTQKYKAKIHFNGKQKHLGRYFTAEEASQAYQNKLKEVQNDRTA